MLLSSLADDAIVDANPAADIADLKKRLLSEGRLHCKALHRLADGSCRNVEVFGASRQMKKKHRIHSIIFDAVAESKKSDG